MHDVTRYLYKNKIIHAVSIQQQTSKQTRLEFYSKSSLLELKSQTHWIVMCLV